MKEIKIGKNDNDQRLDRFLMKILNKSSKAFICKMIRKKNIKINNKKADASTKIYEGDVVNIFLSDETFKKFSKKNEHNSFDYKLKKVYEDENIIIIDKDMGILTHTSSGNYEINVVDALIGYLIEKGEYIPSEENAFKPSVSNRLDRNTKGLLIACKNYETLKAMNFAIKNNCIDKYYKTIVHGKLIIDDSVELNFNKNQKRNLVKIDENSEQKMLSYVKTLQFNEKFSEVLIKLITGKTHQIRLTMKELGHPILGDRKYGLKDDYVAKEMKLASQLLYSFKIIFKDMPQNLYYLSGKEFISKSFPKYERIKKEIFND